MRQKNRYLPSLDGWRAIAIFAVVSAHDPDPHGFGFLTTNRIHQVGWAGVDLFFAISGLLICSRLLDEEQIRGRISLKDFYIRRVFRILPAAYLFLAVATLLSFFHQLPRAIPAMLASALMLRNYWGVYSGVPANELYTDHFWSLSVEEHFYLLLPAILVFVRRRIALLIGLSVLAYAWFLHYAFFGHPDTTLSLSRTDLRIHGLLIPAVLALLLAKPKVLSAARRWLRPWFWIGIICILAITLHKISLATRISIISVCFPFMVASTMIHPRSLACRFLELPPIRYIGRLSYGIYLWQQIFMFRRETIHWPFAMLQTFPWNYVALIFCAVTSYYLLEKPLIKVGHRLAPPATPGRIDIGSEPAPASIPVSAPSVREEPRIELPTVTPGTNPEPEVL